MWLQQILLDIQWHDLINPKFYIQNGGLWLLLFIIFAETGLFVGFFLPGDSLLFVAGIFSNDLAWFSWRSFTDSFEYFFKRFSFGFKRTMTAQKFV